MTTFETTTFYTEHFEYLRSEAGLPKKSTVVYSEYRTGQAYPESVFVIIGIEQGIKFLTVFYVEGSKSLGMPVTHRTGTDISDLRTYLENGIHE